jgi:hypothetical protein
MRALLIRHPWIDLILDGEKTWEIRGSRTAIREVIALVPSGCGTIIGTCELVDCIGPLTSHNFRKHAEKAGMRPSEAKLGHYRQTYAWVLAKPRRLKTPVPYEHPSGAVIWVNLDQSVERKVTYQLRKSAALQQAALSQAADPFATGRIVSVEYDDLNPERYAEGIFVGMVVRRIENRMKVVFAYETGEVEIAWLTPHTRDRWIDKTWSAIVTVEDASKEQREAFLRYVSPERLAQLLKDNEGE